MATVLKIGRKVTLNDLEDMELQLKTANTPITIWLAREFQTQIFVDTRIAALIAAASQRCSVDIVDWGGDGDFEGVASRLAASPEGVAAALFANRILTDNGTPIDHVKEAVINRIIEFGGRAEPRPTESNQAVSNKTLTIYAFDELDPKPIALSKSEDYISFKNNFEKWRFLYFECGIGEEYIRRVGISNSDSVSKFVFEIYQNAFRHGRRSARHDLINPAMRYLRMKRHIGAVANFADRAEGFEELQAYLDGSKKTKKQSMYFEVSITDNGIGIVDRFLSTNPFYKERSRDPDFKHWLINEIVSKSLSSNAEHSGAGHGLRNALRAVREVGGFVSIRSGDDWIYYSGREKLDLEKAFSKQNRSGTLSRACGTQVCMLYPVSAP